MAHIYHYLVAAIFLLAIPVTALAAEQTFSQESLKATIRLTPDSLQAGDKAHLTMKLEKDGKPVTDQKVFLEVYEKSTNKSIVNQEIDVLEDEYVDSWNFDASGDYKVVVAVPGTGGSGDLLRYQVNATVGEANHNEHEHGFFAHHFGNGKWGWWGAGMMILMMVPMMIIAL